MVSSPRSHGTIPFILLTHKEDYYHQVPERNSHGLQFLNSKSILHAFQVAQTSLSVLSFFLSKRIHVEALYFDQV